MAAPTPATTATTNGATASSTPVLNLPSGIQAGDLLLGILRVSGSISLEPPAGWTGYPSTGNTADGSDDVTQVFSRVADGTEGTTVTWTSGSSGRFAAVITRIPGAGTPTVSTGSIGSSASPDAPVLSGLTAADYLFVWLGGWEGEQTSPPSGQPTGYTSLGGADTGTAGAVAGNCRVAGAYKATTNTTAENPPLWGISVADDWTTFTVAVPPGAPVQNGSGTATATAAASGTGARDLGTTGSGTATAAASATGERQLGTTGTAAATATAAATGEVLSIIVNGEGTAAATAAASATGGLLYSGSGSAAATAALAGSGELQVGGTASVTATAALAGSGLVQVGTTASAAGAAALAGSGVLIVGTTGSALATATLTGAYEAPGPVVHQGAGTAQAFATATATGQLQVGTTGALAAAAQATATPELQLGTGGSALASALVTAGGSIELAGQGSASASASLAAAGGLVVSGAASALGTATATATGALAADEWSPLVAVAKLKELLEPEVFGLHELDILPDVDTADSEPFVYRSNTLYVWPAWCQDEGKSLRGGWRRHDFSLRAVYTMEDDGEGARGYASRAVTAALDAKLQDYQAILRANPATDAWDHLEMGVDHDAVRRLDGRGFAMRLSGYILRV